MRALSSPLRKQLESAVLAARRASEGACRASIGGLGVFADRRPEHLDTGQTSLRNGLRAKWRQLGGDGELLVAECAYEQWNRLLFARFLAENNLLLHPQYKAPVTLAECEELAAELGEPDGWSVAARFASEILPGIFRFDDPCVRLRLAPEGRHALEQILDGLPVEMFLADDALGWVYQFWQKDKKDEVNASERKIGGADLGPVTQLFTENYMVRFLLENSLGAWWAARHPESALVKGFAYLRLDDEKRPAAGSFDGWPERAAEVTVMDPCCGSGHFLVEAFSMLWRMRVEEEGLSPIEAQDAVLRDNLFGLELDPRCVQIAMFAVALQTWKVGGGWRQLPVPNIACSGIPVKAPVEEWKALAGGDPRLENGLVRLHALFRDADTLGSLIDPRRSSEQTDPMGLQRSLDDVAWEEMAPLLEQAARTETRDPATAVMGADASGLARAATYLSRSFTLVTTNVPYLKRPNQVDILQSWIEQNYPQGTPDLGVAFFLRCSRLARNGSTSIVVPYAWVTSVTYEAARRKILSEFRIRSLVLMGTGAFREITGEVVNVTLVIADAARPAPDDKFMGLDASRAHSPAEKDQDLVSGHFTAVPQLRLLASPNARVLLSENASDLPLLSQFAGCFQGTSTGDNARFCLKFWEVPALLSPWRRWQSTVSGHVEFGGREQVVYWDGPTGVEGCGAAIRGRAAWSNRGMAVSQMGRLFTTRYGGELFDNNVACLIPNRDSDLSAIRAFVYSEEFYDSVRAIDQSMKVMNGTLPQVPFDIDRWRKVAEEAGSLPEPWSDDPTQWLFEGRPELTTASLQVAVGRLVGYRWPEHPENHDLEALVDSDGIVCLPTVAGEAPAADRVQQVLAAAFGDAWSPGNVKELLEQAGSQKENLVEWLRDDFFKQHCAMFGNRPFVWQVWDGQRDGFSALVNYHRLDRKMLEKLTYTYLGQDWVERQRSEVRDEIAGAEARLSAALELQRKLEAILTGEKPFDIQVRWKELHEQAIGWNPDLNDGVRLNIRPFVTAGVLKTFSPWPFKDAMWKKDRGKNPDGSERHNDIHHSLAEKIEARKRVGRP